MKDERLSSAFARACLFACDNLSNGQPRASRASCCPAQPRRFRRSPLRAYTCIHYEPQCRLHPQVLTHIPSKRGQSLVQPSLRHLCLPTRLRKGADQGQPKLVQHFLSVRDHPSIASLLSVIGIQEHLTSASNCVGIQNHLPCY